MKLVDALSLMFSLGFMIIGLDQSIRFGIANSYWLFMISLGLLLYFGYRKAQNQNMENKENPDPPKKTKR